MGQGLTRGCGNRANLLKPFPYDKGMHCCHSVAPNKDNCADCLEIFVQYVCLQHWNTNATFILRVLDLLKIPPKVVFCHWKKHFFSPQLGNSVFGCSKVFTDLMLNPNKTKVDLRSKPSFCLCEQHAKQVKKTVACSILGTDGVKDHLVKFPRKHNFCLH